MQIHSYCTIRNGIPDFVDSLYKTFLFGIACRKEEMVYSVTFEEGTEKDYDMVGYENNDAVDYIFPTPLHLSACFSYGINRHIEKHGGGRIVFLKILQTKECSPAGMLAEHRADWDNE